MFEGSLCDQAASVGYPMSRELHRFGVERVLPEVMGQELVEEMEGCSQVLEALQVGGCRPRGWWGTACHWGALGAPAALLKCFYSPGPEGVQPMW